MKKNEAIYCSYLLRLWQVKNKDGLTWRCSLEESRSGQRRSFTNLEELFDYLQTETSQRSAYQEEDAS